MSMEQADFRRLSPNAGIAIGPILFIIAILAILAAAIAAGSGSFTSGTSSESARTKSSALVEIGENLKIGMDRITMEGGYAPQSVIIDPAQTNAVSDLFSPSGGGIASPSVSMANNPATDKWHYLAGPVAGFGSDTAASPSVFAVLAVAPAVCTEVNNRTTGTAATPAGADLGNFLSDSPGVLGTTTLATSGTLWPNSDPNLVGVASGCVNNNGTGYAGTYFYEILAIQ